MKIIEYIPFLADEGAQMLVKNYAVELKKRGEDVTVIVYNNNRRSITERQLINSGVKVVPLIPWRNNLIFRFFNKFFYSFTEKILRKLFFKKWLKTIFRNESPDIVHIHLSVLKDLCLIGEELKDVKLFYTCHSSPDRYFSGPNKEEYYAAQKLIKEYGLKLIGLDQEMVESLNELFNINDAILIHNCIDNSRLCTAKTKEEIRKKLGIDENCFLVGHIGRLMYIKNQSFLIDVFLEILNKKENAFLLLVGDGEDYALIKEKINKNSIENYCKILSHRTDIGELLKAMDVFIFPSLIEGCSLALLEAQISGVRCICSDRIPKASIVSANTIQLPLETDKKVWADYALNLEKNTIYNDEKDFYLENVIDKLLEVYYGKE